MRREQDSHPTMALVYGDKFESSSAFISIRHSLAATVASTIATSTPEDNHGPPSTPTVCIQESGGRFMGNSIANAQEMIKAHHAR